MNTIKFGIRFGQAKRGTIVTGKTIQQHLVDLGATDYCITHNGGWFRKGEETVLFSVTHY